MKNNPTNIKDVSRHAGVSTATVSRAFSDPKRLSEKTLAKVNASAKALNYRPNFLAKTFRSKRSNTILVMVPDLGNVFFSRVLSGIEQTTSEAGYSLLVIDTKDDLGRESDGIDMIVSRRVDGVLQLGKTPIETFATEDDIDTIPFVHAIEATDDTDAPSVTLDNVSASSKITRHLIGHGHKRFGVIGGPKDSQITCDRLEGVLLALNNENIEHSSSQNIFTNFNMASGQLACAKLFEDNPDLTALVCMSDDLAIGAIKQLKNIGKRVPDDVSVVGFDDVAYSGFFDPALTTVAQPAELLGAEAARMLLGKLSESSDQNFRKVLQANIVVRDSCGRIN